MPQLSIFEKPACLIGTDREGKLTVDRDVLSQVEQLDGPLVVVAIAGLYRTGKSYLMNRLALSPASGASPDQKSTTGK